MLSSLFAQAQTLISGVVMDTLNNAVEFVNIGFKEKGIGTVCDADGRFSLMVPDSLKEEFITFSHINYKTRHLQIDDIRKTNSIVLENKQIELSDVIVLPQNTSTKWIRKGFRVINGSCYFENLGAEAGIVLKLNKKTLLREVKFTVKNCSYDSVLIRVNIYKLKDIEPIYLHSPLHKMVYKNKKTSNHNLVINEQLVLNQEKVLVGIECVQVFGEGDIHFPAFIGAGYAREISLDQLEKTPFNPGVAVKVTSIN